MWWLACVTALAGAPAGVRPVVAGPDAAGAWQRYLASHGRPLTSLACEPGWPGFVSLCWRVWEPPEGETRTRRWVTTADLTAWRLTEEALREALAAEAAARLPKLVTEEQVVGLPGKYLKIVDGDGWSAAGLLAPDVLAARLGGAPIVVAVPTDSVMLAWKPGNEQVDLAMAVGVHELFAGPGEPVSEVIHAWDGHRWSPWGVATPSPPGPHDRAGGGVAPVP